MALDALRVVEASGCTQPTMEKNPLVGENAVSRPHTPPIPEGEPARPSTPPPCEFSVAGGKAIPCMYYVRVKSDHNQDDSVKGSGDTRLLKWLKAGEVIGVIADAPAETAWVGGFRFEDPTDRGWFPRYYVEKLSREAMEAYVEQNIA